MNGLTDIELVSGMPSGVGHAFAKAENSGVIMAIEEDISQSIEAEIGSVFSDKVIQLTIA